MANRKKSPASRSPRANRSATKSKPAGGKAASKNGPSRPGNSRSAAVQPQATTGFTTKQTNGQRVATPEDSGLTRKDIELFEQALLQKRAQLLGDVTTLHNDALGKNRQDAAGDLSSMPIHMADLGTDNYEQEFTLGLIEGERAVLREIEEALERIRHGNFGLCLATGKAIGKARLRAKPWAKYCYEYTLAQERGRGRRI